MIEKKETVDYKRCHFHSFGYLEFINFLNTPRNYPDMNSSETGSFSFCESDSLDEAIAYAIYGWDAGLKLIKENDGEVIVQGGPDMNYNVCGTFADIPRFLSGVPDNMCVFTDKEKRNKKDICLVIPLSYTCGFSATLAIDYCKDIMQLVNDLQAEYNLSIIGFFPSIQSGNGDCSCDESFTFIRVKEFDEPLVLNSIAYSFHPSFFRRLWFRYYETQSYAGGGYGQVNTNDLAVKDKVDNWIKESEGVQEYLYLPQLSTYKRTKKEWRKHIINKELVNKEILFKEKEEKKQEEELPELPF